MTNQNKKNLEDFVNIGGGEGFVFEESNAGSITARTLDSFGFERADFLKIDCQGADWHVLLGGEETIKRCRPVICFEVELYSNYMNGVPKYAKLLGEWGYKVEKIKGCDFIARPN